MTSKLTLYNGALTLKLGERKLSSLSENRKPRHDLDLAWDKGAIDFCLSKGSWNFAKRSQKLEASVSIEPSFGYAYAFEKPSDWVSTAAICTDEFFSTPLLQYEDEAGVIYCNYSEIYVKFISNDSSYGGDYSKWTVAFVDYVETYLAYQVCESITQGATKKKDLEKDLKRILLTAKNLNSKDNPTKFPAPGSWINARVNNTRTYDRTGGSINIP